VIMMHYTKIELKWIRTQTANQNLNNKEI
jgi:hypothetical protein